MPGEGNTNCVFGSTCSPGWGKFQMSLVLTSEAASFLSQGRSVGRRHQRCVGVSRSISSFPPVPQMNISDITGLVSSSGKSTLLKPLDFLQEEQKLWETWKGTAIIVGRLGRRKVRASGSMPWLDGICGAPLSENKTHLHTSGKPVVVSAVGSEDD